MSCEYILTTFNNNKEKRIKTFPTQDRGRSLYDFKEELSNLNLEDLEKIKQNVESSKSLTSKDYTLSQNGIPIGNTSFNDILKSFKDSNITKGLNSILKKLQTIDGFNKEEYNIIVKQDYNDPNELYNYASYNKDQNLIEINVATLNKYQQIPIYKAFMDYYINNANLESEEFKETLKQYKKQIAGKTPEQIKEFFTKDIYTANKNLLEYLLNFFGLDSVNKDDFKEKGNIVIIENLKTSYLGEAQQTLLKYKTHQKFGYGEETIINYDKLLELKSGDLIKLNFGISSSKDIDNYYNLNSKKIKAIHKKLNSENDINDDEIFAKMLSSSYWVVHKIKSNKKNKKIKILELISSIEGKPFSIKLTDNFGNPISDPMLGNIESHNITEYQEEINKPISTKLFTVKYFNENVNVGYLEKTKFNDLQNLKLEFENKLKIKELKSIENYDGFNAIDLLEKDSFFKHNGNLYKILKKGRFWEVVQVDAYEFANNNHFQVIPQNLNIKQIYITQDKLKSLFSNKFSIYNDKSNLLYDDLLIGDFIQLKEEKDIKLYNIINVNRNESQNVYRFKAIDQFGNIVNFKKEHGGFINASSNNFVELTDIKVKNNLHHINETDFNNVDSKVYSYSILYPGQRNEKGKLAYNKIFVKYGNTSIINNRLINQLYSIIKPEDFVQIDNELYCVVQSDQNFLHVKNRNNEIFTYNKNNIEIIFLKHEEGRLNKDNGYFDLFEDCVTRLNSYRVITDQELTAYNERLEKNEQGSPIPVKCFLKKGLPVKVDSYRNIVGSSFSRDSEKDGYFDVTDEYIKANNLQGNTLYEIGISNTIKNVKATNTLGFQVMKYEDFKNNLNTNLYLKLKSSVKILENNNFKGNTKIVKILSIDPENIIVGLSLYDSNQEVKTTIFPIDKSELSNYVSHVYIPNNSAQYINTKVNLVESYFKHKKINDSDSKEIVMHSFLMDIFKNLKIPVKEYHKNIIKNKYGIDEELNSINAFLTYTNGSPEIIHTGNLKPNSLLHELLHIVFGKFKLDNETEYKNLINSILEEVKKTKDWENYKKLYANWNKDFKNQEIAIKYLTKSKLSISLQETSYFTNFIELLNSLGSEDLNLGQALNNTIESIFKNDYDSNKFIENDLKKDLLIESYINQILKKSKQC